LGIAYLRFPRYDRSLTAVNARLHIVISKTS
jgi:hypothetical protein